MADLPPVYAYADYYPPVEWEYIQEQLEEDSPSDLWQDMTIDYYAMIGKANEAFLARLEFDHQTTKTSKDFGFFPDGYGYGNGEVWRSLKQAVMERTEDLHVIAEEEPEELEAVKEPSLVKVEEPELATPLPEQPVFEAAVANSSSSSHADEKPIGYGLPWAHIFPDYTPGYATSSNTSTTSRSIKWAPLPDATREPRKAAKPSHSRRLRQSIEYLRGLDARPTVWPSSRMSSEESSPTSLPHHLQCGPHATAATVEFPNEQPNRRSLLSWTAGPDRSFSYLVSPPLMRTSGHRGDRTEALSKADCVPNTPTVRKYPFSAKRRSLLSWTAGLDRSFSYLESPPLMRTSGHRDDRTEALSSKRTVPPTHLPYRDFADDV